MCSMSLLNAQVCQFRLARSRNVPNQNRMFAVNCYPGKPSHTNSGEICSQTLREAVAQQLRDDETKSSMIRLEDSLGRIAKKKRSRRYETEYPIEIVFYTAGWTPLTADQIVRELDWRFSSNSGPFPASLVSSSGTARSARASKMTTTRRYSPSSWRSSSYRWRSAARMNVCSRAPSHAFRCCRKLPPLGVDAVGQLLIQPGHGRRALVAAFPSHRRADPRQTWPRRDRPRPAPTSGRFALG